MLFFSFVIVVSNGTFCPFVVVVVCVVGLVFLFSVAPSLAVFHFSSAFNQDVSKWNTGAVTSMTDSKCIVSLYLCGHGAFPVVEYDNPSFI